MFLPVFTNLLNFIAIPLQKPKKKIYNFYLFVIIAFYTSLTLTSLSHIFRENYFKSKPMGAILHVLVYIAINILDIVAIIQGGFCKSDCIDNLIIRLEEVRLFVNKKMNCQTEKKLLKVQKFDFVLIHLTLVPWLIFMSFWVFYITGFKLFLVYALVYFNHYFTSMEVMKMLMLLQFIKHFLHHTNSLFFKALKEKSSELKLFLKTYDKLLDCVMFFNSAFGLQILGTSIVTPLVMVQAIFFNLSQIVFPSVIRTIIVDVATLVKFLLFLMLSYMIATPSQKIVKEFQNARRICHTFRAKLGCNKGQKVVELVCAQMNNRKTRITAAGFFDADYTMILNVLVSTISYVIVFLQINAKLQTNL